MKARPRPPVTATLHDWATLRSELLFVFDSPVPKEQADGTWTRAGELSAWLVRRGSVRLECDGERMVVRRGQWLVCFGQVVTQELSPDAHLLSLRFAQGWPNGVPLFAGALHTFPARKYPRLEQLAGRLIRTVGLKQDTHWRQTRPIFLWRTQATYATYVRYQCHLLTWLAALAETLTREGREMQLPSQVDPRLSQAFQVIDTLPAGAPYPGADLVSATGLTLGRLNRLCAGTYGFTTHGYWERRRVARARLALEEPGLRIKEIAADLGFIQLSHFSAWFRRHTGLSPRAHRRKVQAGRVTSGAPVQFA